MINLFARTAASNSFEVPALVTSNSAHLGSDFPEARVERPISLDGAGRVSFRGVSWRACLTKGMSAEVGEKVLVLGRQSSTTLLVSPKKS